MTYMSQKPQQQTEPPETILFDKFAGIVNTVARERLDPNELETAVNVDLDDRGQLTRRRGYKRKIAGACHSLFTAASGEVYGVVAGVLSLINPNYTTVPLKSGFASDPDARLNALAYAQVGDTIYFSSLQDSGKIVAGQVLPWGSVVSVGEWLSPVIHPTPTLAAVRGKLLGKPPMATVMAYFNGRIYMGNGRQIWATELYLYDFVDKTRTFWTFEADVVMIGVVSDGLYVGTEDGVWWVTGPTFDKMKRVKVMDSPVVAGSMVDIPAEIANPPQVQADADTPLKIAVSFLTTTGFCVAQDGGQAYNLTENKFIFPQMRRASAMFRRQDGKNQYVVVGDSGGTPADNARIGDYVEAELIRATDRIKSLNGYMLFGDEVEATFVGAPK